MWARFISAIASNTVPGRSRQREGRAALAAAPRRAKNDSLPVRAKSRSR